MMNPAFVRKWVAPFYLRILHGNYCRLLDTAEQDQFIIDVRNALPKLRPKTLTKLIDGHWRYAITGSWFAGVLNAQDHQNQIGKHLLASKTCYAGQAHAFALACFGNEISQGYLKQYLNQYLKKPDCFYDQHWAMPALIWIDTKNGTHEADIFLKPGGLWDEWTKNKESFEIRKHISNFRLCMEFVQQHFPAKY